TYILTGLGDIFIKQFDAGNASGWYKRVIEAAAASGSVAVYVDFVQFMPWPAQRVRRPAAFTGSGYDVGVVYVLGSSPYLYYDGIGDLYKLESIGQAVTLVPGKYNYIYFLLGAEGAYALTTSAQITRIYITPRFLLPG